MKTENNLVLAMVELEVIAIETVKIGRSIDVINSAIGKIKSLGFTSIQSGLGNKTPLAGELPYKCFKEAVAGKFAPKTGRLLTESIRDLRASINYGLESGKILTDSKASRNKSDDKKEKTTGAKTTRAASTPKPFDAKKVADNLCDKYNEKQIKALIVELELLIAR